MAIPGEVKHLSNPRKIKRCDSVSSDERKRNSLNRTDLSVRGSGAAINDCNILKTSWNTGPKSVKVASKKCNCHSLTPSSTMHVKHCVNLSGPPDKAKYKSATDSEQVPRGKGDKNPLRE